MTTAPTLPSAPPRRRGRRVAVAVAAAVLVLAGGLLTVAGALQATEGGWFTTATERLSTTTAAMTTQEIDTGARRPGNPSGDVGDLGRVRIRATADRAGQRIFVGIGPTAQVRQYLAGTAHDEMASYDVHPFGVQFRRVAGAATAPPPADQRFWAATTTGAGPRVLEWDKRDGAWTAVAMNADGTPGVAGRADLGLRFGFLLPLGIALLAAGALTGAALITRGRLRGPRRTSR